MTETIEVDPLNFVSQLPCEIGANTELIIDEPSSSPLRDATAQNDASHHSEAVESDAIDSFIPAEQDGFLRTDFTQDTNDDCDIHDCFTPLRLYRKKYCKNMVFSYININSLTRCFHELSAVLTDNLVDFLCVAETKLDELVLDSCISVENYRIYRNDVSRHRHGILTYVRSDITHCRRTEFELACTGAQYIVIEFYLKKQKCFLINTYKPPPVKNDVFVGELSRIYEMLLIESDMVILMGDMNIDMKNHGDRRNV